MELRLIVAYGLLALLSIGFVAGIANAIFNSRERKFARRMAQRARHHAQLKKKRREGV